MINVVLLLLAVRAAVGDNQYIKLDGHGGYDYGYDTHLSSKHESGDHSGHVHGSFSYIDGDGHLQNAHYHADPHSGFKIHATNLPVAPAPHDHFLQYAGGYGHDSHQYKYHGPPAPLKPDGTVDFTPEVKKARAEHFAALAAHKHSYPQYVYPLYKHASHGYNDYSSHEYVDHSSHEYDDHSSHEYDEYYHDEEPLLYAGGYSHDYKYHGQPAPLKHDGTVDDLPEVKAARAHHLSEYAKVLYSRHKRSLHGFGAPLKHDGTVDETPEVKHAKAEHLAAVAHAKSLAHSQPHYESLHYNDFHESSPHADGHRYHGPPALLNHDGTVAETPEVKHAKAILFAAHQEAISRSHYLPHHSSHFDHSDYPSHSFSSHGDYSHKYHGPPAPLNHDGTVAETPEVKHAKAIHYKIYNKFLHRHKRSPIFEPAPLNHDGTVAETPEVKHAKEAFFSAYAEEAAHADHSWVEPEHYDEHSYNDHQIGFSKPVFQSGFVPSNHFTPIQHSYNAPSSHFNQPSYSEPSYHHGYNFKKPVEPAPLNHDGTVADTPEIQAAKAVHLAAHHDALARIAAHRQPQKSYSFY